LLSTNKDKEKPINQLKHKEERALEESSSSSSDQDNSDPFKKLEEGLKYPFEFLLSNFTFIKLFI